MFELKVIARSAEKNFNVFPQKTGVAKPYPYYTTFQTGVAAATPAFLSRPRPRTKAKTLTLEAKAKTFKIYQGHGLGNQGQDL